MYLSIYKKIYSLTKAGIGEGKKFRGICWQVLFQCKHNTKGEKFTSFLLRICDAINLWLSAQKPVLFFSK